VFGEYFVRGAVAECGVQPLAVVEDLDVVGDSEPGPGSGGERFPVIHLVLQRGEERFGGGVVLAHAGAPDTGPNPVRRAELGVGRRGVLTPAVGVKDRPGLHISVIDRHRQDIEDQAGAHVLGELPDAAPLALAVERRGHPPAPVDAAVVVEDPCHVLSQLAAPNRARRLGSVPPRIER